MAIEPARLPPLEAIRNELQVLRRSPMVALSGRAALVEMVDAYLVAQEARLAALEARVADIELNALEAGITVTRCYGGTQ